MGCSPSVTAETWRVVFSILVAVTRTHASHPYHMLKLLTSVVDARHFRAMGIVLTLG